MAKWIKNTDTVDRTWVGQLIAASAYYQIQSAEETTWMNDSNLLAAIAAGDATVAKDDSGTLDITDVNDAINYLKDIIGKVDSDNVPLTRPKITQSGWHYQAHWLDFVTSKLNSFYNRDDTSTDLGFVEMRFYESDGTTELVQGGGETDAAFQIRLDSDCEWTEIDWETDHAIDIIGGTVYQSVAPTNDTRIWVKGVPFLTPAQGGSVPFGQGGMNLRYMGTGAVLDIDGKTAKMMNPDATYHTSEFRIRIKHSAGDQCPVGMMYKFYMA